jgi:hypothetical protein
MLTKYTFQEAKSPVKKSRPYIYVKFLALLGAPCIYDISRLRVNSEAELQYCSSKYVHVSCPVCNV